MEKKQSLKAIILLLAVVPILLGVLLGAEMSGQTIDHVPTAVVDLDGSDFSQSLTTYLKDVTELDVKTVSNDASIVEPGIKSGEYIVAIVFPDGMAADMKSGKSPYIQVFSDGSQLHLLLFAKTKISEILITAQAGYIQEVYQGKLSMTADDAYNYLMPINVNYETLFNPLRSMREYLIAGMIATVWQLTISFAGAELAMHWNLTGIKERLKGILAVGVGASLCLSAAYGVQMLFFGMPFHGSLAGFWIITILFAVALAGFGFIVASLLADRVFVMQVLGFLLLPTALLGGFTFPLISMPKTMQTVAAFMPFSYYSNIIRRLSLTDIGMQYLDKDITVMLLFAIAAVAGVGLVTRREYAKQRRTLREAE